jgi:hypothetical protein
MNTIVALIYFLGAIAAGAVVLMLGLPAIAVSAVALALAAIGLAVWTTLPRRDDRDADIERQIATLRRHADHAVQTRPRVRAQRLRLHARPPQGRAQGRQAQSPAAVECAITAPTAATPTAPAGSPPAWPAPRSIAMPTVELPPVTDAHRRQAFALFKWPGVTFEQAMAVDLRRRLIEACAHGIRTREYQASQRDARKARYQPWCQDAIFGARPASPRHLLAQRDLKRLAAHDPDD